VQSDTACEFIVRLINWTRLENNRNLKKHCYLFKKILNFGQFETNYVLIIFKMYLFLTRVLLETVENVWDLETFSTFKILIYTYTQF
jgi:hypothetical protein